jgi:4-amino-4-deoxy-L-arabinose transferase-like glycosyltransferase
MLGTISIEEGLSIGTRRRRRFGAQAAWVIALFVLTLAAVLCSRLIGPGDLYDKDQSKTIGYTADIVLNHRWLLPRDTLNQKSTKPPLYNWIGAVVVKATGKWTEWAFKVPSILAALVTVGLIIWITRTLALQTTYVTDAPMDERRERALQAGLVAAMFWIASGPAMKHMFLARPDMLMSMFIMGAWCFGTLALQQEQTRWKLAAGFWICVAGAALSKGPAALLPVIYVLLASKLIYGSFRRIKRVGWWWGLGLMLLIIAAWLVPALMMFRTDLLRVLNTELFKRITEASPEKISVPWWQIFVWFIDEFKPWSLLAILAVLLSRRWFRHPLGPAALWVVLGVIFFSCSAGKRADYLLPVYPPAVALASLWLLNLVPNLRWSALRVAVVPALIAATMVSSHLMYSKEAQLHYSDNVKVFAKQVQDKIGDDQRLVFLASGYHPFLPLMGRHAGNDPTEGQVLKAKWVVCQAKPYWTPVVLSQPVEDVHGRTPGVLGLYRMHNTGSEHGHLKTILKNMRLGNAVAKRASGAMN